MLAPSLGCVYLMDIGKPKREVWKEDIKTSSRTPEESATEPTQASLSALEEPGFVQEPQVAGSIHYGEYHALIIGNNAYQHLTPLQTAISDAEAVGRTLRQRYGFRTTLIRNGSRDKIIEALDQMRATLTPRDNLLVYYAGHGVLDQLSGRGYWLPVDARSNTRTRWIETTTITDTLKATTARHAMLVVDSCYSGTLLRGIDVKLETGRERSAYLRRMVGKRSRTALTSGGLEPVLDGGGSGHSVFAKAFLDALNENSEVLEGQVLFGKVRRSVIVNSAQTPEYSDIRNAGHDGGDFLFVPR